MKIGFVGLGIMGSRNGGELAEAWPCIGRV
jgi:3-hydroxyisobutyrate dehydrogenase-like beta-hydroxyacid dehydrogenase